MKLITLSLATLVATATLLGAPMGNNGGKQNSGEISEKKERTPIDLTQVTEDQQIVLEELLQRKIDLESASHYARIVILEEAEDCIQSVDTLEDYKVCETAESQARMELRESQQEEKQALRDDFKALIEEIKTAQSE